MVRFLLSGFLLVALAVPALAQDRVAIITDVTGVVEIARKDSGAFSAAEWGSHLYEGDRIRTGQGARTALLFSNGNMLSVDANSSMTVSATTTAPALSGPVRELDSDLLAVTSEVMLHRAGEGEVAVLGGLRSDAGSEAVQVSFPINTKIIGQNPVFSWTTTESFDSYLVTVQTADGPVWTGSTQDREMIYPETAPSLMPGVRYYWKVEGETMLDAVASPLAFFEIMDDASAHQVQTKVNQINGLFDTGQPNSEYFYILGSYYAGQGLLGEAVNAFSWIAENNPQSASAYRILGDLYSEIGMKDEAIRALQKAVSLSEN